MAKGQGQKPRFDFQKGEFLAQVERLGALGLDVTEIASVLGVRRETIWRYRKRFPQFDHAIRDGQAKAKADVVNSLLKNATDRMNLGAQVFFLKNRAGWKDSPLFEQNIKMNVVVFRNPKAIEEQDKDAIETDQPSLLAG